MTERNILLIYGEGGHRAEMEVVFKNLSRRVEGQVNFIGFFENGHSIEQLDANYELPVIGHKYSHFKMLLRIIMFPLFIMYRIYKIDSKHKISAIISVGPGISILPTVYYRFVKSKIPIVHIENVSRHRLSYTGFIMQFFADKFYVQNRDLLIVYKKAIFSGQLL